MTAEPAPPGGRRLWGVGPEARGERTQARDEPERAALVAGVAAEVGRVTAPVDVPAEDFDGLHVFFRDARSVL